MNHNEALDIITLQETPDESTRDFNPRSFDDYLGQKELKKKLHIWTHAAKERNEPLDHLLLFGPPGLGKTTLAHIMADVMGVQLKICSGPMMERTGDIVAIDLISAVQQSGLNPLLEKYMPRVRCHFHRAIYRNQYSHHQLDNQKDKP